MALICQTIGIAIATGQLSFIDVMKLLINYSYVLPARVHPLLFHAPSQVYHNAIILGIGHPSRNTCSNHYDLDDA